MPPEKRGLISKTTGRSPTMRHWMLTAPTKRSARAHASAELDQPRISHGPAAVDDAGTDDDPLARHDRQRLAVKVTQHVDGELRTGQDRSGRRDRARSRGRTRARGCRALDRRATPPRPPRGLMNSGKSGSAGSSEGRCVSAAAMPHSFSTRHAGYLSLQTVVVAGGDTATRIPRSAKRAVCSANSVSSSSMVGTTSPMCSKRQRSCNRLEKAGVSGQRAPNRSDRRRRRRATTD